MSTLPVEVRKLGPELLQDFLTLFEGEAFADNPKWRSCFCQLLYVDHSKVTWCTRTRQTNRAAACERICTGRMEGYLAYIGGKPAGWCHAAPRKLIDAFAHDPDPDADRIGQITCFVVARPFRRQGVATALLRAACSDMKSQGFTIAEASPQADADTDAENHYGPLSMYLAAGFQVHRNDDDFTVYVRRSLL